jgi:hypothetical protein
MSRRDLIDPDVREPLDQLLQAIPGGFNTIPDIVQRRATVSQLLAALATSACGIARATSKPGSGTWATASPTSTPPRPGPRT